jgi:carbonic anhydrase
MLEIIYRHDPESKEATGSRPADGAQARERLAQGNKRFCDLVDDDGRGSHQEVIPIDLSALGVGESVGAAPKHSPFAAILSCSDARVPIELIFRQAVNDLFSVRLAGNVTTIESVGSLNYAAQHLDGSVKLMVVLGHTGCGAVTAAVDAYMDPTNIPDLTNTLGLRSVVERLFVAVRIAAKALDQVKDSQDGEYRQRLIDVSIVTNAALAAMTLKQLLGEDIPTDCQIVFSVYDIATRKARALRYDADSKQWNENCLAEPPASYELLEQLAYRLAKGSDS